MIKTGLFFAVASMWLIVGLACVVPAKAPKPQAQEKIVNVLGGGDKGWADWHPQAGVWSAAVRQRSGLPEAGRPCIESDDPSTGSLRSPVFTLQGDTIRFWANGWSKPGPGGKPSSDFLLRLAGDGKVVRWAAAPRQDRYAEKIWTVRELKGQRVYLEVVDGLSGHYAHLGLARVEEVALPAPAGGPRFVGLDFAPATHAPAMPVEFYGIPFLALDQSLVRPKATTRAKIDAEIRRVLLLGMNFVEARPLVGDRIGAVQLRYADGEQETYPLIIGENCWWGHKFVLFPEPFVSSRPARRALNAALRLYPAPPVEDGCFIATIKPRQAKLASLELVDDPQTPANPLIYGVTVEPVPGQKIVAGKPLPDGCVTPELLAKLDKQALRLEGNDECEAQKRLLALQRIMYTRIADFPSRFPLELPAGYQGPRVRFEGDAYAELLTNVFHHNVKDMVGKIDEQGMPCESSKDAPWYGYSPLGGTYCENIKSFDKDDIPHQSGMYREQSWSRGFARSLGEIVALGGLDTARRSADYIFRQARIWEECTSDSMHVQVWTWDRVYPMRINGQPLPRHIARVLEQPGTAPGLGCFENDGHGMTALFIYNLWRRLPDRDTWLREHWADVQALGDWVDWQLEHPELSRAGDGVLWSDSEGSGWSGGTGPAVFCDVACIEALLALSEMARSINKPEIAAGWLKTAQRLKQGSEKTFLEQDARFGKTWTLKNVGFGGFGNLGPLLLPTDRIGFDPMEDDLGWRAYNEAAYRRCHELNYKPATTFMIGYGVDFTLESALMLDRMHDAGEVLETLGKSCYHDGISPYLVPELITMNKERSLFYRVGDLGNGFQQSETIKALRMIIGLDDSHPSELRLLPRLPLAWTGITADKFPVLIERAGKRELATVGYALKRTKTGMQLKLKSDRPLPAVKIRLGAFVDAPATARTLLNGREIPSTVARSGDSWWVRMEVADGCRELSVVVK